MMRKFSFGMSILLFVAGCVTQLETAIVKNKVSNAGIILDPSATKSAQFAALELQYHISKMTGAEIPVMNDPASVSGTKIFVGESEFTRELGYKNSAFKNQEYLVKVDGDNIILMGRDKEDIGKVNYKDEKTFPDRWKNCGTCYAVYDFLEKLGFRWYLPTDIGITFTPSSDIAVSDMEIRRTPLIKYRDPFSLVNFPVNFAGDSIKTTNIGSLPTRDKVLWYLRQRTGGENIKINHSLYTYYKRFWPGRPDLFAKGYDGQPPQLCYSNPETLRQVVQDARDYFDGKVDLSDVCSNIPVKGIKSNVFPVFPMDNHSWCKCPECQSQLKVSAIAGSGQFSNDKASEYIFGFVNKVAREIKKTHPDKYIGAGTYAEFCYPPEKIEPNVMVIICLHSRIVYAPHIVENDRKILEAWKNAFPDTPKIIWIYYCFPALEAKYQQFRCFPGFFANHVKDYMKEFLNAGVYGIFYEPSYMDKNQQNLLMDQVEGYINWKLADNPSLDADSLFNDFFFRYYGPAAEAMKAFYLLVENTFTNPANYPAGTKHQTEEIAWGNLGTEERMEKLRKFMDAAERAAVSEPFKTRVQIFKKGIWEYMLKGRRAFLDRAALMAPTMQQSQAPKVVNPDPGDPLTLPWDSAGYITLRYGDMHAGKCLRDLSIRLAHDGRYLYLLYEENNVDTANLYASGTIWNSDEWESYFAKQRGFPYHLLGINSSGKYDALNFAGTVQDAWAFNGNIIAEKKGKTWKTYIAIPLDNLVDGGIKPGEMLYYNLIRSSRCNPLGCWIPTFAGFHAPGRFGEIYLEK